MIRLADYNYYSTDYGGTLISRDEFNLLSQRASAQVIAYTFGRAAKSDIDVVRDACCAVADVIYQHENRNVKSENNDGYSVTYELTAKSLDEDILSVISAYLDPTGLTRRV